MNLIAIKKAIEVEIEATKAVRTAEIAWQTRTTKVAELVYELKTSDTADMEEAIIAVRIAEGAWAVKVVEAVKAAEAATFAMEKTIGSWVLIVLERLRHSTVQR